MALKPNEISADEYLTLAIKGVERVPDGVDTVVGNIALINLRTLPEGVKVLDGNIDAWVCPTLIHLPKSLTTITGRLDISDCPLFSLHEGLTTILWYLKIARCPSIMHLPESLTTIKEALGISDSSIKDINLTLKTKAIYCDESFIDSIPLNQLPLYLKYDFYDKKGESLKEYLGQRLKQGV